MTGKGFGQSGAELGVLEKRLDGSEQTRVIEHEARVP